MSKTIEVFSRLDFKCDDEGKEQRVCYFFAEGKEDRTKCYHNIDGDCTCQDSWYIACMQTLYSLYKVITDLQQEEINILKAIPKE